MPNATLRTARYLTDRPEGCTREDLCAAISTTYYALFEVVAKLSADLFIGEAGPDRAEKAWQHVYRSLSHSRIASKCQQERLERFPTSIIHFAELFLQLQEQRHLSDYQFGHCPAKADVITYIELAEVQIEKLAEVDEKHKRAFCAFVLFDRHHHEDKVKPISQAAKRKSESVN